MKWAVEIQKTNLEARNLGDLLSGLGFSLINGIDYPAFTSADVNDCDTAQEVFEIAKQIRDAITGPAQIDPTFTLGSVISYSNDPPKRHAFLEVQSLTMKMTMGKPTITISPPKDLSGDDLEKWKEKQAEREYQTKLENQRSKLEPAYRDSSAAKMLELLSIKDPSAETIYKIYELAEGHPTNRKNFHAQFGIIKDQFDRFRDAIHNPTVTGDWARHAVGDPPRTGNPMSKDDAEQFVRQIASKWLEHVRSKGTK
jgi:hypothetical protein